LTRTVAANLQEQGGEPDVVRDAQHPGKIA
jgi:hypothetical protein